MKRVKITWDLTDDSVDHELTTAELDLPTEIEVPDPIEISEIAEMLSDEYGWCVESLTLIKD